MNRNCTKIKVKGLNQERIINKIIKNFKIYNFNRIDHNISEFEVDFLNYKKIKKIIKDEGLEVISSSHRGIFFNLKRFFTSYGIIIAIALCLTFYVIQYNFILKIDVFGIENGTKIEITRFVDENLQTKYKKDVDTTKLENLIRENFEEVSSVSVAIIGQSLIININPSTIPDEMNERGELISAYNGIIRDINLIQGTLAVKIGDIIQKGDVLVYPYIIDSQGEKRSVMPKADIYADVWISAKCTHYDYNIRTERTGKKFVKNQIFLSSLLIYSSSGSNPFTDSEVEKTKVTISKNNILPLYRVRTVYYELITIEEIIDFEEVKDKIIEKARQKTLIFLEKNEIIKEENYTIKEENGIHEVEYMLTVNRNIGG